MRFRNTAISKNEEWSIVEDSLNAVTSSIFEVFFLPVEYSFVRTPKTQAWIGSGGYYEYNTLREKGFFNMPELEYMGKERVNSFTNEFFMHFGGPLIDAGVTHRLDLFETNRLNLGRFGIDATLSGGIVPVFFLSSHQKMGIVPLMDPHYAEYDQTNWGSPYLYLRFESTILKFINLVLLYDYSKLSYTTRHDAGTSVESNRHYLILTAKQNGG